VAKTKVKYAKATKFSTGPVGGTMTEFSSQRAIQCKSKSMSFMSLVNDVRCQAPHGHDGMCWTYMPDGSLYQWWPKRKRTGKQLISCSTTPPDHPSYVHPKDKWPEHYQSFTKLTKLREFQDDWEVPPKLQRKLQKRVKAITKSKKG
jgi:hypothetical protein